MSSRSPSPHTFENILESPPVTEGAASQTQKKKRKKRSKKSKAKEEVQSEPKLQEAEKPPVLCISRNKHWRYISSYHGPWLQLPLELLESLLILNMDPNTFAIPDHRVSPLLSLPSSPSLSSISSGKQRGVPSLDLSPPPSPPFGGALPPTLPPIPDDSGKPTPPPIDPGVFRSVTTIRRLIDEASDFAVRAASGLSSAALGGIRSPSASSNYGMNATPWATAQSLGINPMGDQVGNGRNTAMSAMRVHRLRALAVQRLAAAYKADEIAASVMVMQGASALDDIAERVLKVEPNDPDARYVHFFHEKIPSRQLAESTTTEVLDELIAAHPQRLEFYRTRGIVRCFRDEYHLAVRDFTHALKEARNTRKAKHAHNTIIDSDRGSKTKGKKGKRTKIHGQAPPDGTAVAEGPDGEMLPLHPSVLPDAPEPIEPQVLFLRGAAYLQHVVFLIENAILKLEGVSKTPSADGAELRLCYIEGGRYGGVEIGNADGPLGFSKGLKAQAYRKVLNDVTFREQITVLLKKSIRDHERFLAHFDTLDTPIPIFGGNLAQRTQYAFLLTESLRPGSHSQPPPLNAPPVFTTYHPLLVESHFSILLSTLLLGEFANLLPAFARAATLVDGLEGYPVFLPARSMAQAEFIEVLERLAGGWSTGVQPHSLSLQRLAITAPRSVLQTCNADPSAASSSSASPLVPDAADEHATFHAPSMSGHALPQGTARSCEALVESLDCARILLAPVVQRQKERAEKAVTEKASRKDKKNPVSINIPLHGPRVEIVLAWLGAVHLPKLDSVA
ncbi:hypothetical protein K439DRAFT_1648271 [Ramaria rubella]|nr:hypothetical protein K439DRAFT_1648271 [Ramaria rubella]